MGNTEFPEQFSQKEIQKLYSRFKQFDDDDSGDLDLQELAHVPQLNKNPLVNRVIEIFDKNKDGKISFNEFLTGLSCLYCSDEQQKLQFAFKIYDIDEDGYITKQQLLEVLKSLVAGNVTENQLESLVTRTIYQADLDKDGKISYQEFKLLVKGVNISQKMKINKI